MKLVQRLLLKSTYTTSNPRSLFLTGSLYFDNSQRKSAKKQEKTQAHSFEYACYRGDWNLTDGERALNLRDICDSQNLGEQFGEQQAIFEQVLTLFDRLTPDEQAALLEVLTARIQSAAGTNR